MIWSVWASQVLQRVWISSRLPVAEKKDLDRSQRSGSGPAAPVSSKIKDTEIRAGIPAISHSLAEASHLMVSPSTLVSALGPEMQGQLARLNLWRNS